MCADFTEQFYVVQIHQPVCVVDHKCLAIGEVDEFTHLLLEAVTVMLDGLYRHHGTHIGTSAGVADHAGTAADQGDGLVACHLQTLHQAKCHEVSDMKAVCRGIKADIEGCFAVVDEFFDFFFVCHLRDQAAGNEFVINCHAFSPFSSKE